MSKKDRVVFMNDLAKPNAQTNIPLIFDKHYHKFNYAYDIIDYIESYSKIKKQIKETTSVELEGELVIAVKLKKSGDIDEIATLIQEYVDEHNSSVSANVDVISADKLNISINTNFIEEDMYDDNGFNSDSKVHSGESSEGSY